MSKNHIPVAYTVWINLRRGDVGISPPVLCDYQSPGGESEDSIIGVNRHGEGIEVISVRTRGDAIEAIEDFCMTHENVGKGDTFTFRGESKPYLIIRDGEVERY